MPRPWFKELITKIVPPHLERDTYIIFAMAALWLLMWQWRPLPEPIWQVASPVWRKILDLIQLGGWLTVLIATFQVGHWKIFGVTQALDYIQGRPYTKVHGHRLPNEFFEVGWPVTDKGLWNFARHPDFFGFCTAFWVTPTMTVGHLVFAIGLTIYIMFGIFFLETNLSQLYGRSYDQYVLIRSKIIPWFVPRTRGWLLFRIVTVILFLIALFALIAAAAILLLGDNTQQAGKVKDEAMLAGRDVASFPAAEEDYFAAMDGGEKLTPDQVKGRNMWIVWTGGDDRLWDSFVDNSYGAFDLLKTISSYPTFKYSRDNRWAYLGVVNEPCFDKPTGPDPDHFGLWLDKRRADCPPDDFADAKKYPGVKIGARGDGTLPVGSYYGEPTGIVGLRLFPNPAFDEAARKAWDPERYYTDPSYYQRKDLVRPYRVGMSCGFCHVGPNPTHPPADPEHPQWQDLKSAVGAQYFWFDRIFVWSGDESNAILQLLHPDKPGALDTSLASSDNIVNPRTMNAVYNLAARLEPGAPLRSGALDRRRARQQAVQRLPQCRRSARALSKALCLAAARCSRTARTRSARSARSTASTSISACSARNGCCTSSRSSRSKRSRRSRSPRPSATRSIGGRPSSRPGTWRSFCSRSTSRTSWRTRRAAKRI